MKLILMTQSISLPNLVLWYIQKNLFEAYSRNRISCFYNFNSFTMSVRLSASKSAKVQAACKKLLQSEHISIRDAHVIGLLVFSLLRVKYGELYHRKLEIDKSFALRQNQGDFDAPMTILDIQSQNYCGGNQHYRLV